MSETHAPVVPIRRGLTGRHGDTPAVNDMHALLIRPGGLAVDEVTASVAEIDARAGGVSGALLRSAHLSDPVLVTARAAVAVPVAAMAASGRTVQPGTAGIRDRRAARRRQLAGHDAAATAAGTAGAVSRAWPAWARPVSSSIRTCASSSR